jgi:nucleoid-associated protein Lsr2
MSRRTVVELTDDLEGGKADETVTFALDSKSYEIDLSRRNAAKLRKELERYIAAARITGRSTRKWTAQDTDSVAIRKWAEANGIAVNKRGRIPQDIVAMFREAGH